MKGITFGSLHSYDDLNLILSSKEMGSPTVKVKKIDIEGADSDLDLTDFFGEPKYENVTHKFKFSTMVPQSDFLTLFSTVKNALHGKKMRIILDDDPQFYYVGRLFVSSFTNEKNIGTVAIEADCEPYKYKNEVTKETVYLYGKNILDLANIEQGVLNATIGLSFAELTAFTTTTRLRSKMPFLVKPNTQYTFSFPSATFKAAIRQFDKNNILIASSAWVTSPYTFTTRSNTETIAVYVAFTGDETIVPSDIAGQEFQIEEGSTATVFESFQTGNTATVTLINSRMRVVPTINASGDVAIQFNGDSHALSYTAEKFPEIELAEGNNTLTVTGSGAVAFVYQEGEL